MKGLLYTGRPLDAAGGLYHYRNRQYDPNLGDFIQRDPIGYDAGDENLYRYVSNRVITHLDPTGEEPLPPGATLRPPPGSRIGGGHDGTIDFDCCPDKNKQDQITAAFKKSCDCLDKAFDLLTNHGPAVDGVWRGTIYQSRGGASNRAILLRMVKSARNACKQGTTHIICESKCDPGTEGYVGFYSNKLFGDTNIMLDRYIHICPDFFTSQDQRHVAIRESGRFWNSLGETGTGTWKDADVWNNLIESLCRNYANIKN